MTKDNYTQKLPFFATLIYKIKKLNSIILLFLMMPLFSFTQEDKVEDLYLDYFTLPRESLFLHTNKTTYLVGEEIWFKVYAYDRKNENASKATTNVYLGIYDDTGKQMNKKLILTKEGFGVGNIKLDSTLVSGDYFLKASTNWMKNFKEDDAFVQKVNIINPDNERPLVKVISQKEYDIQFLPEGGHMISGIQNVIGIKAIDDTGKGTKASGVILNSNGDELVTFTTNQLGLGKFSLNPQKNESYTAKIILENKKEVLQSLPNHTSVGIGLSVNNLMGDKVFVSMNTNDASFQSLKGKKFKLLLHKDGKIKTSEVVINSNSEKVIISKENLFSGVNILTLVDDQNRPISERMIFNSFKKTSYDLSIGKTEIDGDSIVYDIYSKTKTNQTLNMSISVLPTSTKSYEPIHNIVSSIHLKPYLKGSVENPRYYFASNSKKRLYELDILLLTQGWSRYSWDDIFNNTPNARFDFENGITVNGRLNMNLSNVESLLLYPMSNSSATFVNFDDQGKFYLKNFLPVKGEEIKLSYINKRGKTLKPKMVMSFVKRMGEDRINTEGFQQFESFYKDKNEIPQGFVSEDRETLDEIVLEANLEKAQRKKYRLPFRGKLVNVGKEQVNKYNDLGDFLNDYGFTVEYDPLVLGGRTIKSRRLRQGVDASPPVFYIDNNEVPNFVVLNRSISSFEDIYVDNTPNPTNRGDGFITIIRLFSRRTPISKVDLSKSYQSFTKVDYGFEPVKKFYTPKYISYEIKAFRDYGVIHWEPQFVLGKSIANSLKTINTGLEEINFYIEGVSSDGKVFSQVIRFNKTDRP